MSGSEPMVRSDVNQARFVGKVAIVTGASSGIGRAVAQRIASEGGSVVLVAAPSDEADLVATLQDFRAQGLAAEGFAADVADEATAAKATEVASTQFGGLDVVISNAGFAYFEEFVDTPVAHLDRTLAVNVRGSFLTFRPPCRS